MAAVTSYENALHSLYKEVSLTGFRNNTAYVVQNKELVRKMGKRI